MKCKKIKIIGSNNKYLPLGDEYCGDLIANKLIVNWRAIDSGTAEPILEEKVLTLDIKDVNICAKHVHVDTWFVDEEQNGGRIEFELYWI